MTAILYLVTAAVLLWLTWRFITPMSRAAAIALLLLPLCLTGRAVMAGRVIAPIDLASMSPPLSDYANELGTARVKNSLLGDIILQMVPWREALRRSITAGEWPLLNRYQQCGDDLAGSAQAAPFSPFTWLALLLPVALSFTFTAAISFFVAGVSTFVFARVLGCSETASIVAAAAFTFSAPVAGQILWPLGMAWALMPLVLAATRMVIVAPAVRSTMLLIIALSLLATAGHPETALHVIAVAAAYAIFELVRSERRIAPGVAFAIAGVATILLTAVAWMPMLDAVHQSGEWIVRSWYAQAPLKVAKGFVEAAAVGNLFPFARPQYRPFLLPRGEVGSIVLVLAIAAIVTIKRRDARFFAGLAAITFLIAIGAWPFANIMHSLPLFDRALNDRLIAIVAFGLSMLAAFAIDLAPQRKTFNIAIGVLLLVGGGLAWFRDSGPIDLPRAIADTLPLAIAAAVIGFARRELAGIALIALILVQRVIGESSTLPVYDARAAFPTLPIFEPVKNVREPFRVTATGVLFLPNLPTMYGLEDVRVSTPVTFAPYAETYPLWLERRGFGEVNDLTKPILSMMNVRYAFTPAGDPVPAGWRSVAQDRSTRLVENLQALPRAFIPRLVRFGRTPDQEIAEMKDERDFRERAWIDALQPGEVENGRGRAVAHNAKLGLHIDADMESAGYIVISNAAWRGWRAYVDGKAIRPLRANHAFLAVHVPAGRHAVDLRFLPVAFVNGRAISIVAAVLMIAFLSFRAAKTARNPGGGK